MEVNISLFQLTITLIMLGVIAFLFFRMRWFRKRSLTDELTSLMNYRGICKYLKKLIQNNSPFILVLLDIDNFRKFNEVSYKLGDDVLREFAFLLKKNMLKKAVIARFRLGDEFVVVFDHANTIVVKECLNQMKDFCHNRKFNSLRNHPELSFSFSEGVVKFGNDFNSIETLLIEAERLLKARKKNL